MLNLVRLALHYGKDKRLFAADATSLLDRLHSLG